MSERELLLAYLGSTIEAAGGLAGIAYAHGVTVPASHVAECAALNEKLEPTGESIYADALAALAKWRALAARSGGKETV